MRVEVTHRTVRFALNVWAGWAPIIHANGGFKAGKLWQTPGGKDFKVDCFVQERFAAMADNGGAA